LYKEFVGINISFNLEITALNVIPFEELSFQSTLIRNYFYLLIFTCPGQDSQENLLVRQVLCTSRTSRAWQFHTPWVVIKLVNADAAKISKTSSNFYLLNKKCFFQKSSLLCGNGHL
jgi:hypothetical protein